MPFKYFPLPGEMLIEAMEVAGIVRLKQILPISLHFGLNEKEIVTKQVEIVSKRWERTQMM